MIDCYQLGSGHIPTRVNYKQDIDVLLITTYESHIKWGYGYLIINLTTFQLYHEIKFYWWRKHHEQQTTKTDRLQFTHYHGNGKYN